MEKPLSFSVLVLEDCRSGVTITINISNFFFWSTRNGKGHGNLLLNGRVWCEYELYFTRGNNALFPISSLKNFSFKHQSSCFLLLGLRGLWIRIMRAEKFSQHTQIKLSMCKSAFVNMFMSPPPHVGNIG